MLIFCISTLSLSVCLCPLLRGSTLGLSFSLNLFASGWLEAGGQRGRRQEEKEVEEVEVEEDGEEEDDDYNEDTVEKSYSVSSWSGLCSAPSHTEEEEEEGEEGETDITNVTGGSRCEDDHHEEIIDEIPAEHDGPDKTQISEEDQDESRDETESASECDSDQISDCEAIYSTDWYNHYKQIIKQKSASVTGQDAER